MRFARPIDVNWSMMRTEYANIYYIADRGDVPEAFCAKVDSGVRQISSYLSSTPPARIEIRLTERLAVSVTRHDTATIVISRRRLPDQTAVVHELTHIIAGVSGQLSALLDEGLAVFLQEKFGGADDRSFPAEGRDLHQDAARRMAECGCTLPLTAGAYLRNRSLSGAHRRLAYLQAGSFVRFLIEQYGLAPLMQVYSGRRSWVDSFGLELEVLQARWLQALSSL